MLIRMDLVRLIISENGEQQVIILRERDGERSFPIIIGIYEALAIDRRIRGQVPERPMTHDLAANLILELKGEIEKVIISDIRDRTFFAKLMVRRNGELMEIDSRPSDAIALSAGTQTPIYVEEHVLREVC